MCVCVCGMGMGVWIEMADCEPHLYFFLKWDKEWKKKVKKSGVMVEVNKEDCFPYLGEPMKPSEGMRRSKGGVYGHIGGGSGSGVGMV